MTGLSHSARGDAPESNELLRLIIDSAIDYAIFSTDAAGCVTSWNSGAQRVLGYTHDEIIGRPADLIFTPEDRAAGVIDEERRQAREQGRAEDERWTLRKDGSRFWASGLMMPLADAELGFAKILRDRTESHEAGARLRESEDRFRALTTSMPQLVFRTTPNGARSWASPQWIEFTGLSLEESLGCGWLEAIHPDDRPATLSAWDEAKRTRTYHVEHRIRRAADAKYRWHQTRARPLAEGTDGDWVGTMTDIHELRRLQERQTLLMAELQHRTRNLLALVQAIAAQTVRSSGSLEAFGMDFEARLRALSRIQSFFARGEAVDLRQLVTAELAAYGQDRPAGQIKVEGESVALAAKAAQTLALALHELVTNAVKHGALGQLTGQLDVKWRVETERGKRQVMLEWIESGVKMPTGPLRKGFGSELIERALPVQLGAATKLQFGRDGLRCRIIAPLNGDMDNYG